MGTKVKYTVFGLTLLCCSCFSTSTIMTRQNFDQIQVGTTVADVQAKAGRPFAVYKQGDGTVEYEYIERIPMGEEIIEENHYFLVIQKGVVVGKRFGTEHPPAYDTIYDADPNNTDLQ